MCLRRLLIAATVMAMSLAAHQLSAQKNHQTVTLVHQNGMLVLDSVQVDFITEQETIHHPYIDSMHVYNLDSVSFADDIPELQELHGTWVPLHFNTSGSRIVLKPGTPEFYAVFAVYHTLYAIDFYKAHFGDLVNFTRKEKYRELELYLGDYINCSASEYILNPRARVSPSIIYHEVGHRAFCQLDDTLAIGDVFSMLHNGLMEYFTTTIAGHPVIGEGMLGDPLIRDASKPIKYPRDTYYYDDFLRDLRQTVTDSMDCYEALKKLYKLNKKRASRCTTRIQMTHQTGMLITHPLWKIREKAGAATTDTMVVQAMKNMNDVLPGRHAYLRREDPGSEDQPAWYDFLYALLLTDQQQYAGAHQKLIRQAFRDAGYHTQWVRSP